MSKSIVVDRVKVIAEMARQNVTCEEVAQKAGVGRSAIQKMRKGQAVWRTTAGHVAAALGVTVEELKENAAYRDNKPQQRKACKLQSYTARQLSEMTLQPTRYIVEGVLPMGMGLLVAKPKIGKSWMVLDLCLSVASGVPFLGFQTNQHGTLYLALEDGPSRMQGRILKVLDGQPVPDAARILFRSPRMDEGLLDALGALLDDNPDIHLVCIDTLSKIRPKVKSYENQKWRILQCLVILHINYLSWARSRWSVSLVPL